MIHEIRKVTQMLNPPLSSDVKGLTKTFVENPTDKEQSCPNWALETACSDET